MRCEINTVEQAAKGTEHFKELDFNFVDVLVYTRSLEDGLADQDNLVGYDWLGNRQ